MADVSKINGYNIKDSKARTDIANAIRYGDFHNDYVETHTFDDGKLANLSLDGHTHDGRYYTETEADGKFALISAISDMATKTWVNTQGFITSLAGYATEAWVEAKGYLTSVLWSDISDRPDSLSDFTDDLGSSPTHTHNQYLTEHQSLSAYRTSAQQDTIDDGKVDKVTGKGLSSNDYTTADKNTLSAIASGYRTIFVSTEEPTSADGDDGDIWIRYGD